MNILFFIPGKPIPFKRVKIGRYVQSYTPRVYAEYKELVNLAAKVAIHRARLSMPLPVPYVISLTTCFKNVKKPKYKWPSRSDEDNHRKAILDGLKGIIEDDRHVLGSNKCRKLYGSRDGVLVEIIFGEEALL